MTPDGKAASCTSALLPVCSHPIPQAPHPGTPARARQAKVKLMDMQLLLIIICVAAALFFIGRRFYRCLRKGQCSCGCENDGKKNGCQGGCSGHKLP